MEQPDPPATAGGTDNARVLGAFIQKSHIVSRRFPLFDKLPVLSRLESGRIAEDVDNKGVRHSDRRFALSEKFFGSS